MPADAEAYRYLAIPRLPQSPLPANLGKAHLGTCALTLSTENGTGYVVHGAQKEAAAEQAWMKLLALEPDRLIVSVRLPEVLSGGRSWLADDHLEIWQGPWMDYGSACLDPKTAARQWGIRLSDGAVFAAHGDPLAMPAVLSRSSTYDLSGGPIVTLHLRLAETLENLTVVLSRGDGKTRQRWLLASSELVFGKAETLGQVKAIAPSDVSCAVSEGRLDVTAWGRQPRPN